MSGVLKNNFLTHNLVFQKMCFKGEGRMVALEFIALPYELSNHCIYTPTRTKSVASDITSGP